MAPVRNALNVNPGKYGPFGKIIMPIISAAAAAIPPISGPNRIAEKAIGMNPKPILIIGV